MTTPARRVQVPRNYEMIAWLWMRYLGILIIPLVAIHILIKDVLVGVHEIDIHYVKHIWDSVGWRLFDLTFLVLVLTHGMNGLRQVLIDFVHGETGHRVVTWALLLIWFLVLLWGAWAIISGVRLI